MKPPLNLTTELVPLTYVEALLELAHTFGVEREALFAAARVKPQVLQHPNGRVSFLDFNLLAIAALQACHEPALGLLLGQRLNVSSHGILSPPRGCWPACTASRAFSSGLICTA